jgi:signal transduction histidine kinase
VIGSRVRNWFRRHAGVRITTSLAAALVVALALTLSGVLLTVLLRRALIQSVEDTARQRVADATAAISREGLEATTDVAASGGEDSVVQVLQGDRVVVSSPSVPDTSPLSRLRPGPGQVDVQDARGVLPDRGQEARLVAAGVRAPDGVTYVVVVAQSLEPVETSLRAVTRLLGFGMPALVLVAAAATFVVAGRALRPVEGIRRRVADVEASQLGVRVPVPAARDEVGRLAETMNDMLERIESAVSAQRQFVSDASHELRSPLATIRTTLEVAAAHPELADRAQTDEVLLVETQRLQALVSDLLLLARTDEHGMRIRSAEVDMDDLCDIEVQRLRHVGVAVTAEIEPARVLGDSEQLGRLLRNLVDNAARHARNTVDLRCRVEGDEVVVYVNDDGPGIPPAERTRVFERFVRLDEGRSRNDGGTGLGLSIAAQVARAHGGEVTFVDPIRGYGTCARLRLPVAP